MGRRDLYGECNVDGSPVDVFTAECCMRCMNPECSRSAFGKSKFELRVGNWYERLFSAVPQMEKSDSRFETISAQKFLNINPSVEVRGSWADPRDLTQSAPQKAVAQTTPEEPTPEPPQDISVEIPAEVKQDKPKRGRRKKEPVPDIAATVQSAQPEPAQPEPAQGSQRPAAKPEANLALTNTPAKKGQMLTPPPGVNKTPVGSWDSPEPSTDTQGVRVVKTGAKIKLG